MVEKFPQEVSDLTPSWFTDILCTQSSANRVTNVEIKNQHSGTTGRVSIGLRYEKDDEDLPSSVFCKLAPFGKAQRELLQQFGIGAIEAHFYEDLAADVGVRVPRSWHANYDPTGHFIMVLEDLEASGCQFRRPTTLLKGTAVFSDAPNGPYDDVVKRAQATLDALASLHARFWKSPRFESDLSWVPIRAGFGDGIGKDPATIAGSSHYAKMALRAFEDDMSPGFRAVGELYANQTSEILDLWDQGDRTLIHGDTHEGNLFDDRETAGFFDWAMFSYSPGVRDVSYHLATSLPIEVRRKLEWDLFGRYCKALESFGVSIDVSSLEREYRRFSIFAWVSMASTAAMGSRWQPLGYAMRGMQRATAAVEDLDAIDATLEEL